MNLDIIMYFCGVHTSHIQKYLKLKSVLSKRFNTLLLLGDGKWGCSKELLSNYSHLEGFDQTLHVNPRQAIQILQNADYKLGIFGSTTGRKNLIGNADIAACKGLSIQLSEIGADFIYSGADYTSLISKEIEIMFEGYKHYGSANNFLFSNCYLWDRVSPKTHLEDRRLFFEKYNLDKNKPFFIWTPDAIQCHSRPGPQKAYEKACEVENIIVKMHPNELRRHKAERFNNKWSYELFTSKKVRLLDPQDTHYAYEYMDAMIGYQSTTGGWEMPFYKKPSIYLDVDCKDNLLFNEFSKKCYNKRFEYVGIDCKSEDLLDVISEKKYQKTFDYQSYLNKFLDYPDVSSYEVILSQVSEILS